MITQSQAANIAEAKWGRGANAAFPANRTGAFRFNCAGGGGYIIDDRSLSEDERTALSAYSAPEAADEAAIWAFEDNASWCLPVIFAGVFTNQFEAQFALGVFQRTFSPTEQQMLEAVTSFSSHFPEEAAQVIEMMSAATS